MKVWTEEVLTDSDLNAEFNNILNNALSLISPLTGDLDLNGNDLQAIGAGTVSAPSLYPTGDTNSGLYFSAANTVNIAADGVLAAQFGAQAIINAAPEDSRTNAVDTALIVRSTTSGTPAAGIGTAIQFDAESADENPCPVATIGGSLNDVGSGTEDSEFFVSLRVGGAAIGTKYLFRSTSAANAVVVTHAASADRTITIPDADDTLVGKATTDTLTNKTLTAPAINNPVLNGVSVTGTGLLLAYSSPDQTITAAGALTLAHSLGTTPLLVQVWLKNVTNELGYVTDDTTLPNNGDGDGSISVGCSVIADATNLVVRYASTATTFSVIRADTGARAQITNANWVAIFRAWA